MTHSQMRRSTSRKTISRFKLRNVFAALVLPVAGALFTGALVYGVNKGNVPADTKTTTYITVPGDSLWTIAGRFDTRDDRDAVVQWIERENGIGADIQPGMTIQVPVGGGR